MDFSLPPSTSLFGIDFGSGPDRTAITLVSKYMDLCAQQYALRLEQFIVELGLSGHCHECEFRIDPRDPEFREICHNGKVVGTVRSMIVHDGRATRFIVSCEKVS